jgi:hypothetical protein
MIFWEADISICDKAKIKQNMPDEREFNSPPIQTNEFNV